jgi:phosphate transport system permease protein
MSTSYPVPGDVLALSLRRRRRPGEAAIHWILRACALISILTTVGIIVALAGETINFFRQVHLGDFFFGTSWAPTFGREASFGVLPLVLGTIMVAGIGILVAVPLGVGIAMYLSEYAPDRVRRILKPFLEILAGIPTVVLGFFALNFVTAVLLKKAIPGIEPFNSLSAGLVVGIMIVPTIASLSEDAMRAVPGGLREAAYGLGASKRRVALRVVMPAAISGVMASIILGLSRAIGETMIVAIAGGNQPQTALNPLTGHQTMTASIVQISLGDTPAGSITYKTIFALGTTLFAMTLVLNYVSLRVVRRFREHYE